MRPIDVDEDGKRYAWSIQGQLNALRKHKSLYGARFEAMERRLLDELKDAPHSDAEPYGA